MNYLKKRTDLVKYAVLLTAGLCANDALAFGSLGADVDQLCTQAGRPLETAVNGNCSACHNNPGGGGGGAGRTAFEGDVDTTIAFFCPPPPTPEPTPAPTPEPTPEPTPAPTPAPTPTPTPPPDVCTDDDGDGVNKEGGLCGQMDCNDGDPAVNPLADENCTDGIDNNCNNLIDAQDPRAVGCPDVPVCTDEDDDGYAHEGGQCGPMDCDDRDSDVNPGERENCGDSADNNCDGNIDTVDASCEARNDDDDSDDEEEENRRRGHGNDNDDDDDSDDEEEENRRRGHGNDNDNDDDDERRDSRRSKRESRDRD